MVNPHINIMLPESTKPYPSVMWGQNIISDACYETNAPKITKSERK